MNDMDDEREELLKERKRQLVAELKLVEEELERISQKKCSLIANDEASTPSTLNHDLQNRFPTYKKLPGTTDFGREFEQTMCGLYALKLSTNPKIEDFEMTSNNIDDGKFDDIGLNIAFANKTSRRFLFQLKHKKSKNLNLGDLKSEGKNNDFVLKKYVESILGMNTNEDTVYILSTTSSTKIKNKAELTGGMSVEQCDRFEFEDLLVNTRKGQRNAVLEIKSDNLEKKFYFFTSQMNVKETEETINGTLNRLLQCDIYGAFTSFMRNWWLGRFVLTKHDVIGKITELSFSPYVRILTNNRCNQKTESLQETIMTFSLTIVENCGEDIIDNIWKEERSWTDDEFSKTKAKYGLNEDQRDTVLWYLGKIPQIVKVDDSNEGVIWSVVDLVWKGLGHKKIILSFKVPKKIFKLNTLTLDILKSLSDVIKKCPECWQIVQTFKVSLQGRGCITLENLVSIDKDLPKLIGMRELLKMSQQDYLLIGSQREESSDDDNLHVPRTICLNLVTIEDVLNLYQSSQDDLVIINCDENFALRLSQRIETPTTEVSHYLSGKSDGNLILLSTQSRCDVIQFEEICEKSEKSNVYLLQPFDEENLMQMLRKGKEFIAGNKNTTRTVKETEILEHYDNPLHSFCASPGMGKSTLMKFLYNNCPSDCLAVYVSLIDYNSFLATKPDFEEILSRFLQVDGSDYLFHQMKDIFRKQRKLYMFLDGLDEVNSQHVECILNFTKRASSQGTRIWVSSRENLREVICERLKVVPLDIKEFDKDEQKIYIYRKLKCKYDVGEIKKIINAVFNSADLNNSQNLLGIPLQLYIITETFLFDKKIYESLDRKNFFVLTQMYKMFFEGKIKFAYNKLVDRNQEPQLGHLKNFLQAYETPALLACLDGEECQVLGLNSDATEASDFMTELKSEGDKYGIIERVNDNNEAIFDHQTYAEYFACVWFRRNLDRLVLIRDKIFSRRYQNLRLIFDVMLAENNPLHLSVIYKDVEQFGNHLKDADLEDAGGRTALHLASSYGNKYDPALPSDCRSLREFKRMPVLFIYLYLERYRTQKRETDLYVKLIEMLLERCKTCKGRDNLFKFDCASYALQSECLYPIEKMLENKLISFKELRGLLRKYYDGVALIYYCAKFGYPNLLSGLIKDDENYVMAEDLLEIAIKGCDGDVCTPPRRGNVESLKILIENCRNVDGFLWNMLTVACANKCFDVLEILMEKGGVQVGDEATLDRLVQICPEACYEEMISAIKKFDGC